MPREVAKQAPRDVRMVLTLGSPFAADADRSHAGLLFRLLNGHSPALTDDLARRLRSAPPVPTWAVYSRSDGVVPWRHCLQDGAPDGLRAGQLQDADSPMRNIEVHSSHFSMPWNAQVLGVLREALRLDAPATAHRRQPDASATM